MPILMNDVLIKVSVKEKSLIYTEFDLLGFNCSQHLCCLCFSNKVIFAIMCPTRNGWPNPPSQRICQGASKSATIKFASSRLYFFYWAMSIVSGMGEDIFHWDLSRYLFSYTITYDIWASSSLNTSVSNSVYCFIFHIF